MSDHKRALAVYAQTVPAASFERTSVTEVKWVACSQVYEKSTNLVAQDINNKLVLSFLAKKFLLLRVVCSLGSIPMRFEVEIVCAQIAHIELHAFEAVDPTVRFNMKSMNSGVILGVEQFCQVKEKDHADDNSDNSDRGLRGWEFCPFSPFFANFSTFTKIPQVPSFQAHSPVKTVFPKNAKNARKSQNTPSTNPYQNETQFSPLSLKSRSSGHPRPTKSVICPPVISGTNSRASSLKSAKFRHGTAGLSNGEGETENQL